MDKTLSLGVATAFALSLSAVACGGETPAPKTPTDDTTEGPARPAKRGPKLAVSQELGEIDPKAAEAAIDRAMPQIQKCHKAGTQRVEYLAGDVKVFVRLDARGKVRWAYFEESTIGDRQTEKCMLDALSNAPWPAPTGGEAEVRKGFGFDAGDARPPADWPADKVSGLASGDAGVQKCKSGVSGTFKVTAYVEPAGDGGKISAVGVAPPSQDAEAQVDCLVDALRSLKVPSPGSYAAKVSFTL